MAEGSKSGGRGGSGKSNKTNKTTEALGDALKEAGQRAAELAQNPIARSMLAAGLVSAAAAGLGVLQFASGHRVELVLGHRRHSSICSPRPASS